MDRTQKAAVIDDVADQISNAEAVFAVDYRGISVPAAALLRTRLRDADASFRVVKNTLTERAADQAQAPALKEYLKGPTAITVVRGDVAVAAKAITELQRTTGTLAFKGGLLNGGSLTAEQILEISRLPSRDVLIGRLVGLVASPLTGLATSLGGLIGGLARQLQQIADEGLIGGGAQAPVAEASPPSVIDGGDAADTDQDAESPDTPEPGPDPDPIPGE